MVPGAYATQLTHVQLTIAILLVVLLSLNPKAVTVPLKNDYLRQRSCGATVMLPVCLSVCLSICLSVCRTVC